MPQQKGRGTPFYQNMPSKLGPGVIVPNSNNVNQYYPPEVKFQPQELRVLLDTTTSNQYYNISGNNMWVQYANSTSDIATLQYEVNGPRIFLQQGILIPFPFNHIYLSWTGSAGAFLHILYWQQPNILEDSLTQILNKL